MPRAPDIILSDPPETPEVLAMAITDISDGMKRLLASGLNRKAIEVLLFDATHVPKRQITKVIDALGDMKRDYCR
jgi:hypothetical protein